MFHDALDYAVELGLLPANPVGQVRWTAPKAAAAVNPQTVASPTQVRAILAEVARLRPELTAFFGCLYYAALRPEEAVALRRADLILPAHRRGQADLLRPARAPAQHGPAPARHTTRVASSTVPTGLSGSCRSRRSWPICSGSTCASSGPCRTGGCSAAPAAASSARAPTAASGTPPSTSHSARSWPPCRSPAAPYDLRHAALSLWLNATGSLAEVAARAGNSVHVLEDVYAHCVDGRDEVISRQIEDALDPYSSTRHRSRCVTASGYTHRRHRPDPVRLYVRE